MEILKQLIGFITYPDTGHPTHDPTNFLLMNYVIQIYPL